MEYSVKVLIVGGMIVLTYGFLLGFPMSQERRKAPQAPRHLVNVHLESLIQGAVLLGLAVAASFSTLSKGVESVTAWLLVLGGSSAIAGGTLNWLQKVEDPFKSRSPGFLLQAVGGPVSVVGIVLMLVGVLKAL